MVWIDGRMINRDISLSSERRSVKCLGSVAGFSFLSPPFPRYTLLVLVRLLRFSRLAKRKSKRLRRRLYSSQSLLDVYKSCWPSRFICF